jgi:hypothetical protein
MEKVKAKVEVKVKALIRSSTWTAYHICYYRDA